ncbi:MAG: hypothetical protein ACLQMH_07940 [Solirubrobacteraceae bacterium]
MLSQGPARRPTLGGWRTEQREFLLLLLLLLLNPLGERSGPGFLFAQSLDVAATELLLSRGCECRSLQPRRRRRSPSVARDGHGRRALPVSESRPR